MKNFCVLIQDDPGMSHTYWKVEESSYGKMLVGQEGDVMMPPETWEQVKVHLASTKEGESFF